MKIEIYISTTNTAINKILRAVDLGIEKVTQSSFVVSFEVEKVGEWLTEERKVAFEKGFNEEIKEDDIYFIVDKITASN